MAKSAQNGASERSKVGGSEGQRERSIGRWQRELRMGPVIQPAMLHYNQYGKESSTGALKDFYSQDYSLTKQ
jgi:hypothetical protein